MPELHSFGWGGGYKRERHQATTIQWKSSNDRWGLQQGHLTGSGQRSGSIAYPLSRIRSKYTSIGHNTN